MHVVDEILAYHQLAEDGMAPESIAARFGQSVGTIRQRLKLANLSPKILDAMRADEISIEQARALAISDDHGEQETVWFECDHWSRQPQHIRAALTREHVRSNDRLARLVGIEVYEAAGGGIVRDLFAEDATTFLTDRALLVRLASETLERAALPLQAEGWKWVEITLDGSALYNGGYGRIHALARELTPDEHAEIAAFGDTFDELAARIEAHAEGSPEIEADETKLYEVEQKIEAIRNAAKCYDPAEKAFAGCIVTLSHCGAVQIGAGYVKPEDRAALARLQDTGEMDDAGNIEAPALPANDTNAPGYSAALVEELTAIRTAAMRVSLAARADIALAAILHPLVAKVFYDGPAVWRVESAIEISGQRRDLTPSIKEPEACRALVEWDKIRETWADHIPGNPRDLWEWLLEQPADRLTDLLAFVTAANLNAVEAKHDQSATRLEQAEQLATALDLDMSQFWSPDRLFLCRLTKAGIADVMREARCAPDAVRAVEKANKTEAVQQAEAELRGKPWLPCSMRLQCEEVERGIVEDLPIAAE